ncbi:prepilin peptidase [Paenibacillus glycinis]|uniref:Prepilin peptidase n=1 Tax=Paenibacillus glycinis TaxID=2697035 RepID=A0ABW9XRU1_9BACL|nr:A24 family peptidase [Paenibacillus glycinis]NBD25345.1 prepilin peptidase [Paenibacillus glycinis]
MTIAFSLYLFVLGLVCGSFFNVVGLRVPVKKSIVHPPSHCTSCGMRLAKRDLVPVFSYLLAGRKCRQCGAPVSFVYPLGELATGLLFAAVYLRFGISLELIAGLLLVSLAVIVTVSDLSYMLIPNSVLLAFLPLFIFARLVYHEQPLWQYALGAVLGGGALLLVHVASRGGMGFGDIKLFAVCGLVVGPSELAVALLVACLTGTVIGGLLLLLRIVRRKQPIPFGPFLALGTLAAYFFGDAMIRGYLSILS